MANRNERDTVTSPTLITTKKVKEVLLSGSSVADKIIDTIAKKYIKRKKIGTTIKPKRCDLV